MSDMNPPGGDMSEDGIDKNPNLKDKVGGGLNHIAKDVRLVRFMHVGAFVAAIIPVAVLLILLWMMVTAFSAHLSGSNEFLTGVVTRPSLSQSANFDTKDVRFVSLAGDMVAGAKAEAVRGKSEVKGDAIESKHASDRSHLYDMIASYQTNLSTSSVAIISILVIAIVVVTIAVLRATLAVAPYDPSRKSDAELKPAVAGEKEVALPSIDFIKNFFEALASAFSKDKKG